MYNGPPLGFASGTVGAGTNAPSAPATSINELTDILTTSGAAEINLQFSGDLDLGNSQLEVLGQKTFIVPAGRYIRFIRGRVRLIGSQIIWRGTQHIPVTDADEALSESARKIETRDGISIGKSGIAVRNVWVDSVSIQFSGDEGFAVWGDVKNWAFTNSIISQPFLDIGHPDVDSSTPGEHSMTALVGGPNSSQRPEFGTIARNLFQSGKFRNPSLQSPTQSVEVINNVIDNPGTRAMQMVGSMSSIVQGNQVISGSDTSTGNDMLHVTTSGGNVYAQDNFFDGNELLPSRTSASNPPFPRSGVPILDPNAVIQYVKDNAGPDRTAGADFPLKALDDLENGTSRIAVDFNDFLGLNYVFSAGSGPAQVVTRKFQVAPDFVTREFPDLDTSKPATVIISWTNAVGESVGSDSVTVTPLPGGGGGNTGAGSNDPEMGLVLTSEFGVGTSPAAGADFFPDESAVVAIDFTDLDGSQGGLIAEFGGSGDGTWLGFTADGTFQMRAGDGGDGFGVRDDHARLSAAPGVVAGDGTLVFQMTAGANEVRAVWYDPNTNTATEIGTPIARVSGTGPWANTGTSNYLRATVPGGVPVGQLSNVTAYGTASGARYYRNQTLS